MDFALLGPLLVRHDDGVLPIAAGKQRVLLAALLLATNRVVSIDSLAYNLWDGAGPASARVTVQGYVKRLRQSLGDRDGSRIITRQPGYVIRTEPDEVDIVRFTARCGQAEHAARAGDWPQAADRARSALALWRGEPLMDVPSSTLSREVLPRLTELRLNVLNRRIEADLHLGAHQQILAELRELAADHPTHEQFHAHLMLALYRCGRQGDALAVYQELRHHKAVELGLDPTPDLQRLHQRVLEHDPALSPPPTPVVPARTRLVPQQLPRAVHPFVGRADALSALDNLLPEATAHGAIAVISGSPGVGKTALAVHWSRQHAQEFPDGQLYANLRGFDPVEAPIPVEHVLRGFLDGLGAPAERMPAALAEQTALLHSLLAGKRVLIVLDNARTAAQVRPLLPAGPGCLAIVTSRDPLTGLMVSHRARPIRLDVFGEPEAHELLSHDLAPDRIAAEPEAIRELITLCGRLPLALSNIAAQLLLRPNPSLAALVNGLRDARDRLDALDSGADPATDIRPVLACSYRVLSPAAARMFRLLGSHPGPDITVAAAASLAAAPPSEARQLLTELTSANLLAEHTTGRYNCHDLLRAYAIDQAHRQDSDTDRQAAAHRVTDHYLHTARTATRRLNPTRDLLDLTLSAARPGVRPEELADADAAMAWFRAEHLVLLALTGHAAEFDNPMHAWQLPWSITVFLDGQGHWAEMVATHRTALAATERHGDVLGQAYARLGIGMGHSQLSQFADAATQLESSRSLFASVADPIGQAHALLALGWLCAQQGRFADALHPTQQALERYRATGRPAGQAIALSALGWYETQLGHPAETLRHSRQALEMFARVGDPLGVADCWDSLGHAHHQLGNHADALTSYEQALALYRQHGQRFNEAQALINLGRHHTAAGDPATAETVLHQALTILDDLKHPSADALRAELTKQDGRSFAGGPGSTVDAQ